MLQPTASELQLTSGGATTGGQRGGTGTGRYCKGRSASCNRHMAMLQPATDDLQPIEGDDTTTSYNRQPVSCNRHGAVLQPEAGGATTASCRQCWNQRHKIYNQRHKKLEPARAFIATVENGLCCRRDFPGINDTKKLR